MLIATIYIYTDWVYFMGIENMDRIYKDNDENYAEALKQIGLYFGYLYWKKASIEKKKNH